MSKFYIVWNGLHNPTKRHASRSEASIEARRLCEKHPGQEFTVLEALGSYRGKVIDSVWVDAVEVTEPVPEVEKECVPA